MVLLVGQGRDVPASRWMRKPNGCPFCVSRSSRTWWLCTAWPITAPRTMAPTDGSTASRGIDVSAADVHGHPERLPADYAACDDAAVGQCLDRLRPPVGGRFA